METTWKKKLLVASIDFGTTYSGFAISFEHDYNDDDPRILSKVWKPGETSGKTPTVILLDPNKQFNSFGFEAEEKYAELAADEKQEHKDWYMFRRFKMLLYQDKQSRGITTRDEIRDINGKLYPAINVFSFAIQFMKDEIIKFIKEKFPSFKEDEIYFVLTTPAIWSEHAKAFMRKAARNAGIKDDHLCIALEPECAAVYLHKTHLPALDKMCRDTRALKPESCHLIVDLGGGTSDIVAHMVNDAGNFDEILSPCGGPFGSDRINMEFEKELMKISGAPALNDVQKLFMEDYLILQREFELKKRECKGNSIISINIPYGVKKMHKKHNKEKMEMSLKQSDMAESVTFTADKMRFSRDFFVQKFFRNTIDGVIELVEDAIKRSSRKIEIIFCVGGFSDCDLLKTTMNQAFPDHTIIIPPDAVNTVMKGAVIFGRNQTVLNKRKSPYTVGLDWNEDFDSNKHPSQKKQQTEYGSICTDIFKILVKKGDLISYNEPTIIDAYTAFKHQEMIELPFYRSEVLDEPKFVTDMGCYRMGSLSVKTSGSKDYENVKVKVYFGSTEIKVEATDIHNRKFEVLMNFSETEV